jgi:imidazolonepropionase-like amidohydrolase
MWYILTAILVGSLSPSGDAQGVAPAPPLALVHANIRDGAGARPRRDMTILIRNGRIERILPGGGPVPADMRIVDVRHAWVMPGLIDAHSHIQNEESARAALRAGVTTARILGVDRFVDLRLGAAHRAGAHDFPDLLGAGYQLRPRLSDAFFTDFPAMASLRAGVAGEDAARQVVRANAGRGVAFIKVMATERAGTVDTDFRQRTLGDAELNAAVNEAARSGLLVAAHAHTDDAARSAVLAGARTIEHGTTLSRQTLGLMRGRNVCFVPTLAFWADMAGPGGQYDHPDLAARAREMLPQARATVRSAARMGVTILAGSDMRYERTSMFDLVDEVMLLRESGLSAAQAINGATGAAAACLGISGRTGAIREGLEADLLILESDPIRDLSALRRPRQVVNDGVIVDARSPAASGGQ